MDLLIVLIQPSPMRRPQSLFDSHSSPQLTTVALIMRNKQHLYTLIYVMVVIYWLSMNAEPNPRAD